MSIQTKIPVELRKRVRRGTRGRWVFVLATYGKRVGAQHLKIVEVTNYTDEASATIYFKNYLDLGNHVLIKIPEITAHLLWTST